MENNIYEICFPCSLPIVEEAVIGAYGVEREVVGYHAMNYATGTYLLSLGESLLVKRNLSYSENPIGKAVYISRNIETQYMYHFHPPQGYSVWDFEKEPSEELEKTRTIQGTLFLTPDLRKVWISHYDLKFLRMSRHKWFRFWIAARNKLSAYVF